MPAPASDPSPYCPHHPGVVTDGGKVPCTLCERTERSTGHPFSEPEADGTVALWRRCTVCQVPRLHHAGEEQPAGSAPSHLVPGLPQPSLDGPGGAKLQRHPRDTSAAAAAAVSLRSGTQRRRVLEAIVAAGETGHGLTDEEGQQQLELHPNSYTARRLELCEAGYVDDSGDRRHTTSGNPAIVWLPTLPGMEALERAKGQS